jgi:hypothetical protein
MRALTFAIAVSLGLATSLAQAHGPQMQVTDTNNKITTREIIPEPPYDNSLTPEKSTYVLPILQAVTGSPTTNYWTVMPNSTIDPILQTSEFQFGPGLAYSYGQSFTSGFHFNVSFTTPLERWNGTTFVNNPGPEAVGAFRGDSTSAADQVVVTSSGVPAQSLLFNNIAANYPADSHSSMRFRLLGNGTSALVALADGIYLLSLQISSTQPGLASSDPFSLVLYKNASSADLAAAVTGLGVDPSRVQYLSVPEPTAALLAASGLVGLVMWLRKKGRRLA